jgi:hypothetical protein
MLLKASTSPGFFRAFLRLFVATLPWSKPDPFSHEKAQGFTKNDPAILG